ncbi:MAG TPA: APC family permease [Terriglobales bacterium]|nr:APC family permease [Terriglobales bacterium]
MDSNVESARVPDVKQQLRREMGLWDVLLFNIAAVLGPRWIAAAAHNGTSSISLWIIAALFFFVPTAMVITELSTRFPHEGGLYIWSKEAFGDFHGFVAGWTYWIYTIFYFPGLLMASASMGAYILGVRGDVIAHNRAFILAGSLLLLFVAVWLNIIGLNIGKWLQNAGGVGTYLPLLMLTVVAFLLWKQHGSVTHFTWTNIKPTWNWHTVNFWSQIAFAFTGLELASAMSDEVKNPHKTFPRAIWGSGVLIALIYIIGTIAVLIMLPAEQVNADSGVFQALTSGSVMLRVGIVGVIAAILVSVGNAGGVGSTVAGVARVPFIVGVDRYMPEIFSRIHPRWRTPYVSILVQAGFSILVLLLASFGETVKGTYQGLVDAAIILYFVPFLYMYAAVIKLAYRKDRQETRNAILIPGGKAGVWIAGSLGFIVVAVSICLSVVPPGETANKTVFVIKLIGATLGTIALGLILYFRGARQKSKAAA